MAGGHIAAVLKHLPKARLVFDHFHAIKLMNEKLTILRRDLYGESRCTRSPRQRKPPR